MLPATKNNREQEHIHMDRQNFIDGKKEGGGLAPHPGAPGGILVILFCCNTRVFQEVVIIRFDGIIEIQRAAIQRTLT